MNTALLSAPRIDTGPGPTPGRLAFLDWVRVGAFGLLIFYHVGMFYVTWDWHVKSNHASHGLEPLMLLTNPWRLTLLFLVSGVATRFMADKLSLAPLLRARLVRLGIPLLFGMAVLVAPQPYYEVVEKLGYGDGFLAFYARYLSFDGSFCRGDDCLILPTWNHLWFVAYLLVYTLVLGALLALLPRRLAMMSPPVWAVRGPWLLVLPVLFLALLRLFLLPLFEITHALVDDWYNHAMSFSAFLFGFAIARQDAVWARAQALRVPALLLGLVTWVAFATYVWQYRESDPPEALRMAMRIIYAGQQWGFIIAILGFARRYLNHGNRWLSYLSVGVFPFYIIHQTAIVVAAHHLKALGLPVALEAVLLIAITIAACLLTYEAARRIPVLRPLFGLKRGGS